MSQTGNGTVDIYTERVTLAQDSPGVNLQITVTNGTWTGDNDLTTSMSADFKLDLITVHFDATISNNCIVTLDANDGASYDTVLKIAENVDETHNVFEFGDAYIFESGDEITVACNVGADNAYCRIVTEAI